MQRIGTYIDLKRGSSEKRNEPKVYVDTAKVAALFEKYGFLKSVAGEALFTKAVRAFKIAHESGKGLIMSGPTGVGKTQLANAIVQIYKNIQVVNLNKESGKEKLLPKWWAYVGLDSHACNILMDDFGSEHADDYTHIERAGEFIVDWHCSRHPGTKFFVTTNLTLKDIDTRYSARVSSRLAELCVAFRMDRSDNRGWTSVK